VDHICTKASALIIIVINHYDECVYQQTTNYSHSLFPESYASAGTRHILEISHSLSSYRLPSVNLSRFTADSLDLLFAYF